MADYAQHVSTKTTPQDTPVRGRDQVCNEAGGYVFPVTWEVQLRRFLILGHEGGCYYASERRRTVETVDCIDEGIEDDWYAVVNMILAVSKDGLAVSNDPAIFALAYIIGRHKGTLAASYALDNLHVVCRIGTHLFDFCTAVQQFRGWGRALRQAVAHWYTYRAPMALAHQVTKYKQRNGWSHRDVLRKAHPQAVGPTQQVLQYVTQREDWLFNYDGDVNAFLEAVEEAKTAVPHRLTDLISQHGLVREHIPTEHLNDVFVWEALLEKMPLGAMVRNLNKMTAIGLLSPLGVWTNYVVDALGSAAKIKRARLHPLTILIAARQYARGHGDKSDLTWTPVPAITAALERAFYLAFDAVEPTGKNFLLAVDVSGSMTWNQCAGAPLTCCEGAAVMAMLAARTEPNHHIVGFQDRVVELGITAEDTLEGACRKAQHQNFGGTDCGAAMAWAEQRGVPVDVFCVYTDGQTWAGHQHPFQALQQYRERTGIRAKLATFQMDGSRFSIADPSDAGMMDFAGFDASAPTLLADFANQPL
jgi:60 kDa SS-A/Ro ribonucleoprotein